jgi:hypothetical protein
VSENPGWKKYAVLGIQQWDFSSQYRLTSSLLFEAGYVGTRGVNLFREININQAPLASAANPIMNAVTGQVITTNTPADAQLRAPSQGASQFSRKNIFGKLGRSESRMPETGTSGLMSGLGNGTAVYSSAPAPNLDSTPPPGFRPACRVVS